MSKLFPDLAFLTDNPEGTAYQAAEQDEITDNAKHFQFGAAKPLNT